MSDRTISISDDLCCLILICTALICGTLAHCVSVAYEQPSPFVEETQDDE